MGMEFRFLEEVRTEADRKEVDHFTFMISHFSFFI
jgi:hypothetical protein